MPSIMHTSLSNFPHGRAIGHAELFRRMAADLGYRMDMRVSDAFPAILGRINHGRWLADCPFCAGAELVTPDEPVFICLSCGNKTAGHRPIPVQFPTKERLESIELVLADRPMALRNWAAYEPLTKLVAENLEHGIPVKEVDLGVD